MVVQDFENRIGGQDSERLHQVGFCKRLQRLIVDVSADVVFARINTSRIERVEAAPVGCSHLIHFDPPLVAVPQRCVLVETQADEVVGGDVAYSPRDLHGLTGDVAARSGAGQGKC